jgi:predicted porin
MSGINFDVMITPGEDKGSEAINNPALPTVTPAKDKRNEAANGVSSAVTYTNGGFKVGLGVDSKIQSKMEIGSTGSKFGYDSETDLQRLVASYDSAAFGVAGMLQNAKQSSGDVDSVTFDVSGFAPALIALPVGKKEAESLSTAAFGGYYNIDAQWKLKALAVQTSFKEADVKFNQMDLGVDYKLAKNTMLFGYVGNVQADAAGSIDKQIGENTTIGIGIDHVFGL